MKPSWRGNCCVSVTAQCVRVSWFPLWRTFARYLQTVHRLAVRCVRLEAHRRTALIISVLVCGCVKLRTPANPVPQWHAGTIPAREPTLPLVSACLCPNISLVAATSFDPHITVRPGHHHCALSSPRAGRPSLAPEWDMESCSGRSSWMRSWTRRMVREGCVGARDGRRTNSVERGARGTVSVI